MSKVLIVVDMQNDFVYENLGTIEAQNIVPNIVNKVVEARQNGDIVIFTKDVHHDEYYDTIEGKYVPPHCRGGESGSAIIPELTAYADHILYKSTYGTFGWADYSHLFNEVDEIELCGVCTDICVVSNALILRSMYPTTQLCVDASCCAGLSYEKHEAALSVMQSCNIKVMYPF